MSQQYINVVETTTRRLPVTEEAAISFVINYLYDEFCLRDIHIKNGRRILTEEFHGSHSWVESRDVGPEYPVDRAGLQVIHELRAQAAIREATK